MKILLALLLAVSLSASAQSYAHRSNPGVAGGTSLFITSAGSGKCPGTGCVTLNTEGATAALITVAGTYAATLEFRGSNDKGANTQLLLGYPVTNGACGTGLNTLAANATGTWYVPTMGFRQVIVYGNAWTSNTTGTINMDADPAEIPPSCYTAATQLAPNGISTLETPAAASPVACTAANVAVLSANTRSTAWFQSTGSVDLCLCYHATTCPAPSASGCGANGVALKAATSAGKADGGTWIIGGNSGKTWSGGISCGGSAGGLLHAGAY